MKPVQVVFPVLRGSRRFIIERGRRWSVVEHVLLHAIAENASSADDVAAKAGLPRRVIIEALTRLMRIGWAEIIASAGEITFSATALGRKMAPLDQLPAHVTIDPRWRGFAIEQISGGVFRSRELDIRTQGTVPTGTDDQIVVHLAKSQLHALSDLSEVFTAIEGEDERIIGVDQNAVKLSERFGVVTVRDDVIEGLPARATPALRMQILTQAQGAIHSYESTRTANPISIKVIGPVADVHEHQVVQEGVFSSDDVIIDGPAHRAILEGAIKGASERIIIHSTFITDDCVDSVLPWLFTASAKGVAIDILWGQDDIGSSTSASRKSASRLQKIIAEAGRSDSITVHPFSTNSHAKLIIADNSKGGWFAIIGSCNWLSSNFTSFEVSVRIREPALVGKLIHRLANMARGRPGLWSEQTIRMTTLGRQIEKIVRPAARGVPMRFLFGADHSALVLEARNRAAKRIFVLSHRFGIAAQPVTLLPTLAAIKANNVQALAYYGRTTGPLSGANGAELTRELAKKGLEIHPVHRPRVHAKVLGWDDNFLAISSLNWLSADPSEGAPLREIGVLVEAPRIADNLIIRFEHERLA